VFEYVLKEKEEEKEEEPTEIEEEKEEKEGEEEEEGEEGDEEEKESESEESEPFTNIFTPGESYYLNWKKGIKVRLDENIKIKIVDFGNACWTHKHFTDNIQTREYRSPEAIIGSKYYPNTDIWSLGCMIFEMLTGQFVFKPEATDNYEKDDDHLALIMEACGRFPKKFALSGRYSREYFNRDGKLKSIKKLDDTNLKKIMMKHYNYPEDEATEISEFLLPMLTIKPDKRISAFDALKLKWLWT
jgi:serine/threonine-protein kinase SRPK1